MFWKDLFMATLSTMRGVVFCRYCFVVLRFSQVEDGICEKVSPFPVSLSLYNTVFLFTHSNFQIFYRFFCLYIRWIGNQSCPGDLFIPKVAPIQTRYYKDKTNCPQFCFLVGSAWELQESSQHTSKTLILFSFDGNDHTIGLYLLQLKDKEAAGQEGYEK